MADVPTLSPVFMSGSWIIPRLISIPEETQIIFQIEDGGGTLGAVGEVSSSAL
jgi:hypothetical protein